MTAITSAQSGNVNSTSTWAGGVVPGDGDTAIRDPYHVITIPNGYTWTIGNDPALNTPVVSGPSYSFETGGWLIEDGAEVILKGSWMHDSGTFVNHGKITVLSTYGQKIIVGTTTGFKTTFESSGSGQNWSEIDASECGGTFTIANLADTYYNSDIKLNRVRMYNVAAIEYQYGFDAIDVILDVNCGNLTPVYRLGSNRNYRVSRLTHKNPSAQITLDAAAPDNGILRECSSLIFPGQINVLKWTVGVDGGMISPINAGAGEDHGIVKNVLAQCSNDWNFGIADYENLVLLQNASDNQHGIQFPGGRSAYWRGGCFQAKLTNVTDLGDMVTTTGADSPVVFTIEDVIELPNARWYRDKIWDSAIGSGTLFSLLGNENTKIVANGNTHFSPATAGETATSITDQIPEFQNNLCYGPNLTRFLSGSSGIDDIYSVVDHNSGHWATNKYSLPTNAGQFLSAPGANDLDVDPLFYDTTRGFHSYATVLGYTGSDYEDAWDYCLAAFAAINDPQDPDYNALANVTDYLAWLKAGWAPGEIQYVTAGAGGNLNDWIGFAEPQIPPSISSCTAPLADQDNYTIGGTYFSASGNTVEFGDASTYAACTVLVEASITSEDVDEISGVFTKGALSSSPIYAYVTNADSLTNAVGFEVEMQTSNASEIGCTITGLSSLNSFVQRNGASVQADTSSVGASAIGTQVNGAMVIGGATPRIRGSFGNLSVSRNTSSAANHAHHWAIV